MGFYDDLTPEQFEKLPKVAQGEITRLRERVALLEDQRATLLGEQEPGPIYGEVRGRSLAGGTEVEKVYLPGTTVMVESEGARYRIGLTESGDLDISAYYGLGASLAVLPRVTNAVVLKAVRQ